VSGSDEQLSAFLDDELDTVESELFVRRLGRDEALRATSMRYSVIRDVIRDDLAAGDPRDLVARVAAETGPVAAPAERAPASGRSWLRPVAGAAVAATVAMAAVLSLQQPTGEDLDATAVTVPEPALAGGGIAGFVEGARRAGSTPDRLSEYYLNHAEYAPMFGGQNQRVRLVTTPGEAAEETGGDGEPAADEAAEPTPAQ
jgi:sigma-E factor negative regulatory protein RseA